jgi:ADP-ribosyl-[dinitrogen reductase] hydrolase
MTSLESTQHQAQGPLRINSITLPQGGVLGMTHCPGRRGVDGSGLAWLRVLAQDLDAIQAWGASTVLSLVENPEFARLGVPGFAQAMASTPLTWLHIPITDMGTPGPVALAAWQQQAPALNAALARGDRVLVHCAAGLGRTGMVVAKLLTLNGLGADAAIAQVRSARPGTIETEAQAQWVRGDWGNWGN